MSKQRVTAGEKASIDVTLNTLLAALPDALAALERLMGCGNPVVEVKAASSVLSFNQKIEEARLSTRVEALEPRLRGGSR